MERTETCFDFDVCSLSFKIDWKGWFAYFVNQGSCDRLVEVQLFLCLFNIYVISQIEMIVLGNAWERNTQYSIFWMHI